MLSLLTLPIGPSNGEDTDPPYAIPFQVLFRARKPRFSTPPDKRVHPLPTHLVDQTLLSRTDHDAAAPRHLPTLSH